MKLSEMKLRSKGKILVTTPVKTIADIGRNDPCICGSGKKYKKCCWKVATGNLGVENEKN